LVKLDAEAIEKDVGNMAKNITRSFKQFTKWGVEGCVAIASKIKDQIDVFKPQVPLLLALRSKGMTDRHWDELSASLGFPLRPDDKYTSTPPMFELCCAMLYCVRLCYVAMCSYVGVFVCVCVCAPHPSPSYSHNTTPPLSSLSPLLSGSPCKMHWT
jgi:hypothetical protein